MPDGKHLQENFLNKIKALIPPNSSFANELADVLEVSTDSVYRRLRNETSMTVDDIAKLSKHFKVSFDVDATISSKNVTFTYSDLRNSDDLKEYLRRMLQDIKELNQCEIKGIYYAAIDVPIFHHFRTPELNSFKVFYWLKGVINDPELRDKKYDKALIDPELLKIGQQIYEIFKTVPSVEIWTNDTINSMLEQTHYYWESGFFKTKEDALSICNHIEEEFLIIQQQATSGYKELDVAKQNENSKFSLYQSEIEIGSNAILVEKANAKAVYITCHTLNYLFTTQQQYCIDTKAWIESLIKKSVLISSVSEKQRYRFFKIAFDKIQALRIKINEM